MKQENFTIASNFDELPLQGTLFVPDEQPKGIVQILHGMCEYKERYFPLMTRFCSCGFVVVCHDQRGHGDSIKKAEDLGYFYETSGEAIVQDAVQITEWIRTRYPDLPITLFGHSMGSMVARCYLQEWDTLIDKAIICGSPTNNPLSGIAIMLTKCIALLKGERYRSPLLAYLATGKGNDRFKGEGDGAWLSHNRENIQAFHSTKKGTTGFTCNGFENLFRLMQHTYTAKRYQVKNKMLSIHFVSGGDDAVLGSEKNFDKTLSFMRKTGYVYVTGKLYQGLRHEIHNEYNNEEVLTDLCAQLASTENIKTISNA